VREDILEEAKKVEPGPGKFEGEGIDTIYFYLVSMDGDGESCGLFTDEDNEPIFECDLFIVTAEEADALGLTKGDNFAIWTSDNGFVNGKVFPDREDFDKWLSSWGE